MCKGQKKELFGESVMGESKFPEGKSGDDKDPIQTPVVEISPRLVCDRISVTFNASDKLIARVEDFIKSAELVRQFPCRQYRSSGRLPINLAFANELTRETFLTVQVGPRRANMRDMRISYNPSKLESYEPAMFAEQAFQIPWDLVLAEGHISEYHAAVDVDHIKIDDIFIGVPRFHIEQSIVAKGTTRYIGSLTSGRYFCIYDKQVEIIESNRRRPPHIREEVPPHSRTRFEARLRPRLKLRDLEELKNPFAGVAVSGAPDPKLLPPKLRSLCALTIQLARHQGMNGAISYLPKRERAQIRHAIEHAAGCPWWDPEKIWTQHAGVATAIRDEWPPEGLPWT
jgi:hypothetical protein